jgi:hypothetical protein
MRFSVHTCTEGINYVPNENKTYKPRKNIISEHTIPLLWSMGINVAPYFIWDKPLDSTRNTSEQSFFLQNTRSEVITLTYFVSDKAYLLIVKVIATYL